jgi:hypothetical protein
MLLTHVSTSVAHAGAIRGGGDAGNPAVGSAEAVSEAVKVVTIEDPQRVFEKVAGRS